MQVRLRPNLRAQRLSHTKLWGHKERPEAISLWPGVSWSGRRDSNPRPIAWEAIALPLRHSRVRIHSIHSARRRVNQRCH
jgi:hypothetical protein